MRRILLAEDEDAIRDFVVINLKRAGYDVVQTANGEEALAAFERENGNFSVALLDIMMPGIDGCEVCKRIREKSNKIGIIMLSAKSQEMDKVRGLMLGADDYVTKPFSPSELTARVDALCRRLGVDNTVTVETQEPEDENSIVSGPFKRDYKSRTLYKNKTAIDLTQVEFQIMEYLMKNPNVALKRAEILHAVWGESYTGEDESLVKNPNVVQLNYEVLPHLATDTGVKYEYDSSAGVAVFHELSHSFVFLKPGKIVTITIRATDGSNVQTKVSIMARNPA